LILTARGKTDQGLIRANNEDNFYLDEKLGLLVVADGMGGHASGETASKLSVNIIRDYFQGAQKVIGAYDHSYSDATNKLKSSINLANTAVFEAAQGSPQLTGMGTTIAAALLTGNRLSIAHIGDSRVYLIRAGDIEQLTDDHSIVNEQIRSELITKEEAVKSDMKNILTKALGVSPDTEPDLNELAMFDGDIVLLCSDGLTTMVSDEAILEIISFAGTPDAACNSLISAANENGGKDNITVVAGYIKKKKWYQALFKFMESFRR
jgi:serine/threonine protein phosphatase PrpC